MLCINLKLEIKIQNFVSIEVGALPPELLDCVRKFSDFASPTKILKSY